jgi:dicarboxylate transporter 10
VHNLKEIFCTLDPSVLQLLMCSTAAGIAGGICGNPGDVVNVRMQNDGQLPVHLKRNYLHAFDGLIRMTKEEGVASLFRGVGPNINRAILMTSSQCVSYDRFKAFFLKSQYLNEGMGLHLLSSVLAVCLLLLRI